MKGYMYILECADGSYYTGSTINLKRRLEQHQHGKGANHTKKHFPVKLVYFEEFKRIDTAFYREKQVQGWSRKKKESLIYGKKEELHGLAECRNESHYKNADFGCAQSAINRNDSTVKSNEFEVKSNELTHNNDEPAMHSDQSAVV